MQLAFTFNGNKGAGFKVEQLHKAGNFIERATGTVYQNPDKKQFMHIGAHNENTKKTDNTYTNALWPEVHMGNKLVLKATNVDVQNDYGFKIATDFGP